jgi:hypothetical protein
MLFANIESVCGNEPVEELLPLNLRRSGKLPKSPEMPKMIIEKAGKIFLR